MSEVIRRPARERNKRLGHLRLVIRNDAPQQHVDAYRRAPTTWSEDIIPFTCRRQRGRLPANDDGPEDAA